jgi:acyl-CoA dehydrogenase
MPARAEMKDHEMIEHTSSNNHPEIRDAIRALCAEFPDEYFRKIDESSLPGTFVNALTKAGWLAALIPQEYGGSGLGLTEASVIMEEINRCGGNSAPATARCTTWARCCAMAPGAEGKYLPKIASGEWRLQSMGVTEPTTGTDTTKIKTSAVKKDGATWSTARRSGSAASSTATG